MEFSEEWKSLWATCSTTTPPLLISSNPKIGPLIFNPSPKTLTLTPLFSSPSLSPNLPPPPHIHLSQFLTTPSSSASLPPSAASALSAQLRCHHRRPALNNLLQFLRCPNNTFLLFFPTGENSDRLGFVWVFVSADSGFVVDSGGDDIEPFVSKVRFHMKIIQLSVNSSGFLFACTAYSIHWFRVDFGELGSNCLVYLGCKLFKSCGIVCACWSPHLPFECVVLLESGELWLFDLDSCFGEEGFCGKVKGNRLRVSWDSCNLIGLKKGVWLGFEFSWHPRIFIVAHSNGVFLVDLRLDGCNVSCSAKIPMVGLSGSVVNDRFLVFSKAGFEGFYFTVATKRRLLLFDVRKPLNPVLLWDHGLNDPSYINVFKLSELRSNVMDDAYKWANESGFCILMGSFWNCEFSIFCYGSCLPTPKQYVASKITSFCKSLYAWDLPSELVLSGRGCHCGSCLTREEFEKDALNEWIEWQKKKDIVLGFAILDKDLSALLSPKDGFGGFTLIRWMSSGKLEAQKYHASWDFTKNLEESHEESSLRFEHSLLYSKDELEYNFPKEYHYLKLDYLHGYLNGDLAKVLVSNVKDFMGTRENESFGVDSHKFLCEMFRAFGHDPSRSYPEIFDAFRDVSLPSSIHEVALRRMWASLPMEFLQFAFSSYLGFPEVIVDNKEVSLEYLIVPQQPQSPPFFLREPSCRSNRWSDKVKRSDAIVGPILPLPVLLTLHKARENISFSVENEMTIQCNEVMKVASKSSVCDGDSELQNDYCVSLGDDGDESWNDSQKQKPFLLYKLNEDSGYEDRKFTTLISKVTDKENEEREMVGLELFDDLCPIDLKYDAPAMSFSEEELNGLKLLKRKFSKWQEDFKPYHEFRSRFKLHNQNP